jgi:hypothetical protein
MMSAARDMAPEHQRNSFFGALSWISEQARAHEVEACVVLSDEYFTNFFLENMPQVCVGIGEGNWGPSEAWLPADRAWVPGHPCLAGHVTRSLLAAGFDPAFSQQLELDRGVMTVYHELDHQLRLPLVPIVQNCVVPPLMPLGRALALGRAVGEAIRSFPHLDRVAVVGVGGLSRWIGTPRMGEIAEDFDRWFLAHLENGSLEEVLDLADDEIDLAGDGAHEIRSWLAVAGAVAPGAARTLTYEPVYPWITGMAVSLFDGSPSAAHNRKPPGRSGADQHGHRPQRRADMTSTTPNIGDVDETVRRIKELSDKAIELSKQNGRAWLDAYEKMLEGFLRLQQQTAQGTQVEWVSAVANTQADFVRDVSQAYLGALREQLK